MIEPLKNQLIELARKHITDEDPAHDFEHAIRVMRLAEKIALVEGADLAVVIPAALFHDVVNYQKNDPKAKKATDESAEFTGQLLANLPNYPKDKIQQVKNAIARCSFSKAYKHTVLEEQVVQDADGLEATGAIAIMRTFASTGIMQRPFYHTTDPFCKNRKPNPRQFALDLFFSRLFKIKDRIYTRTGRKLAERRTQFLNTFLEEFNLELQEVYQKRQGNY